MLHACSLNLSSSQDFLRFRLEEVLWHFVLEVGVHTAKPERLLPVILVCKETEDLLHDWKRSRAILELQRIDRVKIGTLIRNREDQSRLLPAIRLGAGIGLAEMGSVGDVGRPGEILAFDDALNGLREHPGLNEPVWAEGNIWGQSLDQGFPAVFLFCVQKQVDQLGCLSEGIEPGFGALVVILATGDEHESPCRNIFETRGDLLRLAFLNVPMLMPSRILESTRGHDASSYAI